MSGQTLIRPKGSQSLPASEIDCLHIYGKLKEILKGGQVVNLNQLRRQIYQLKKERNAIILAHYYQRPEIQDAADLVGDSFCPQPRSCPNRRRNNCILRRPFYG